MSRTHFALALALTAIISVSAAAQTQLFHVEQALPSVGELSGQPSAQVFQPSSGVPAVSINPVAAHSFHAGHHGSGAGWFSAHCCDQKIRFGNLWSGYCQKSKSDCGSHPGLRHHFHALGCKTCQPRLCVKKLNLRRCGCRLQECKHRLTGWIHSLPKLCGCDADKSGTDECGCDAEAAVEEADPALAPPAPEAQDEAREASLRPHPENLTLLPIIANL